MSKNKTQIFGVLIVVLTLVVPKTALANMLGENPPLWSVIIFIMMTSAIGIGYYLFFVLLNTVVEYSVFYLFTRRHISNKARSFILYGLANLVSYLPTILVFVLSSTYYSLFILKIQDPHDEVVTTKDLVIPIIIAESVAVAIETIILSVGVNRLYKKGFIDSRLHIKKVLLITVVANLLSFAFSPILWTFK